MRILLQFSHIEIYEISYFRKLIIQQMIIAEV